MTKVTKYLPELRDRAMRLGAIFRNAMQLKPTSSEDGAASS